MKPDRRRGRIVRRVAMALLGVVLMPAGYVASVALLYLALNADVIPLGWRSTWAWNAYTWPAESYVASQMPGSAFCGGLIDAACGVGCKMSVRR